MAGFPATSTAGAVGVIGSAFIAGGNITISALAVPGLLSANVPGTLLAKQWDGLFTRGKAMAPKVAAVCLLSFAYEAYQRRSDGVPWKGFVVAGLVTIAMVPYTLVFMSPTNSWLQAVAKEAVVVSDASVKAMVTKWKGLNLLRSVFPLAGSVIGIWSLLG